VALEVRRNPPADLTIVLDDRLIFTWKGAWPQTFHVPEGNERIGEGTMV